MRKTKTQVPNVENNTPQPIGAMAPKAVATPFPPLNLKKIGKICPKHAPNATMPNSNWVKPKE